MKNGKAARGIVKQVQAFLREAEVEAYLVGGSVRDHLLGKELHDLDFAVSDDAMRLSRRFADLVGGAFVPLDTQNATARVVLRFEEDGETHAGGSSAYRRLNIDFTTLRGHEITRDLAHRDFTVNAMAIALDEILDENPTIIDPFDGQTDLSQRVVRGVQPDIFREDAGRLLRAVRIATQLQGHIEPVTASWLRADGDLLGDVSKERIRDELIKILILPNSRWSLEQIARLDLLGTLLPELEAGQGIPARAEGDEDIWSHSLKSLEAAEKYLGTLGIGNHGQNDPSLGKSLAAVHYELHDYWIEEMVVDRPRFALLKFAVLLHDVGKPAVVSQDSEGKRIFEGHETAGAAITREIFRRLKFASREEEWAADGVRTHGQPAHLTSQYLQDKRAIYRFFRDTEEGAPVALVISLTDYLSRPKRKEGLPEWPQFAEEIGKLYSYYFTPGHALVHPPTLLNGNELMRRLHLQAGPEVGQLLEAIREAQAADLVHTREEALEYGQRWLQQN
ncbi:MAG: CCA tRNA nucleotidyltransferase [Chloroflexi bacterium]|nr:CCA tRNA nucleotidyltransferase [Chloroflexota bacterium]